MKGVLKLNIKINISADGLESAINNLASSLKEAKLVTETTEKVSEKTEMKVEKTTEDKSPEVTKVDKSPSSGLTFEQVRVKLAEISQKGKQKELKDLITEMGADKLSDVPEEKYAELLERAEAL